MVLAQAQGSPPGREGEEHLKKRESDIFRIFIVFFKISCLLQVD
jgi:hypothetical protein